LLTTHICGCCCCYVVDVTLRYTVTLRYVCCGSRCYVWFTLRSHVTTYVILPFVAAYVRVTLLLVCWLHRTPRLLPRYVYGCYTPLCYVLPHTLARYVTRLRLRFVPHTFGTYIVVTLLGWLTVTLHCCVYVCCYYTHYVHLHTFPTIRLVLVLLHTLHIRLHACTHHTFTFTLRCWLQFYVTIVATHLRCGTFTLHYTGCGCYVCGLRGYVRVWLPHVVPFTLVRCYVYYILVICCCYVLYTRCTYIYLWFTVVVRYLLLHLLRLHTHVVAFTRCCCLHLPFGWVVYG